VAVRGLERPAPCVQENLRRWGREGHKREINEIVARALEKKGR